MKPVRFEHWRNRKQWTIYQLALLLRGWEPVAISDIDIDQRARMNQEIKDWKKYALDCPSRPTNLEIGKITDFYTTTYNSEELIDWASTLEGIAIPSKLESLLSKKEIHKSALSDKLVTAKERKSFLLIIGALSDLAELDLNNHYVCAQVVQQKLNEMGIALSENNIADKLENASTEMEEAKT